MWELKSYNQEKEKMLLELGRSRMVSRLLAQRDIDADKLNQFLETEYAKLSHPHTLPGVKEAVDIFCQVALLVMLAKLLPTCLMIIK